MVYVCSYWKMVTSSPEKCPLSREERLADLILYLTTRTLPNGLTRNDVRNIKNQAKTHQWDVSSEFTVFSLIRKPTAFVTAFFDQAASFRKRIDICWEKE